MYMIDKYRYQNMKNLLAGVNKALEDHSASYVKGYVEMAVMFMEDDLNTAKEVADE